MKPSPPSGLMFALETAALGYRVMPVSWPSKVPMITDWPNKASTDPLEIGEMWETYPKACVGIACGPVLAVDLDVKDGKNGISAWEQWCGDNGVYLTVDAQTTLTGGAHKLFMLNGERLGNSSGSLPTGIDIRGYGGYIVAYDKLPPAASLPAIPKALSEALRPLEKPERRSGDVTVRDPSLGVHPYAQRAISYELARLDACAREEADLWNNTTYEVACNLIEFANSPWSGYTLQTAFEQHVEHAPQDPGFGPSAVQKCWDSAVAKVGDGDREEPEGDYRTAQEAFDVWVEKTEHRIFDASPTLQHIRQAAHSRLLGSGAVLANVLGRVLAEVPPGVVLPPVIGSAASLNLGFAMVGKSGDGKSTTFDCGTEVLGINQEHIEIGLGSGEGIIEAFLEEEKVPDPRDPTKMILKKVLTTPPSRIFNVDEVEQLGKASGRDGSTLMSILRTALTGGALKSANATAERRRSVQSKTYRLVSFVGVQEGLSGILLNDSDAGTPQRMLWISTIDKTLPEEGEEPDWPGCLEWNGGVVNMVNGYEVQYPDHIKKEIRRRRVDLVKRGIGDPLESHMMLTRLKVAAALTFLHDEVDITEKWWAISGYLMEWSKKEQDKCKRALAEVGARSAQSRGRTAAMEEEAATDMRMELLKRKILAAVPTTRNEMHGRVGLKQREILDIAIAELVSAGSVVAEECVVKGGKTQKLRFPQVD